MNGLSVLKKNIQKHIDLQEKKLLDKGYSDEDLQILYNALECLVYPIITEHFKHLYDTES